MHEGKGVALWIFINSISCLSCLFLHFNRSESATLKDHKVHLCLREALSLLVCFRTIQDFEASKRCACLYDVYSNWTLVFSLLSLCATPVAFISHWKTDWSNFKMIKETNEGHADMASAKSFVIMITLIIDACCDCSWSRTSNYWMLFEGWNSFKPQNICRPQRSSNKSCFPALMEMIVAKINTQVPTVNIRCFSTGTFFKTLHQSKLSACVFLPLELSQ